MTRLILIALIISVFAYLFWLTQPPFRVSSDMAFTENYQKKANISQNDDFFRSYTRYDESAKSYLNSMDDSKLREFRCSDNILRTNQGAYILKNAKTDQLYRRRIQNTDFINFMRKKEYSLPIGKKILTARICETEDKMVLLFYSIGSYDSANVDNNTILQTIHDSTNNETFLQIIPSEIFTPSKHYRIAQSDAHVICEEPFQITKTNLLYLLCNEEISRKSNYFISELNLTKGDVRIINKCSNEFTGEIRTTCN